MDMEVSKDFKRRRDFLYFVVCNEGRDMEKLNLERIKEKQ
jgi:hypothetical protein